MSHCKLSSEYPLYQGMPTVDINSYKIVLLKYGPSHNHFKINIRKGLARSIQVIKELPNIFQA